MSLRPGRVVRPAVITRSVARTAAVADPAAVIAQGVERRNDRGADHRDTRSDRPDEQTNTTETEHR
jgi:hypothetical protein